ncbi:MAG TPA: MarR family transcriptional regulator [Solirubrobacteraceae bacterium]|nr:MarR family transcriptional regulator [Solirubrobacteraceae bacterium]
MIAQRRSALGEALIEQVADLRRGLRRQVAAPSLRSELTGAQAELLRLVRREPGISVGDAAARLRLAANTVSTLVRQLAGMGLLQRTSDPGDRRVGRLALTAQAAERLRAWRDARAEAMAAALERLDAADRDALGGERG